MAEFDPSRPPWSSRMLAVTGYLGLTPLVHLFWIRRDDAYVRHHQAQALAMLLLLLLSLSIWPICQLLLERYIVTNRIHEVDDIRAADTGMTIVFLAGLGLWGLASLLGIAVAIAGSNKPLPVVARLARRPWLLRLALIGNSVLMTLVILVAGLGIHASSLAREDIAPAPVYFLYDNTSYEALGTWLPKLFCYRISRAACDRWGPGSVVVAPITAENIRTAIAHGRFVVLQSHGRSGAIKTVDGWSIWPNPPASEAHQSNEIVRTFATPGKELQFVYISACCGGERAADWQQRFAPAEVVTFDRLTGAIEMLWWLWFDGPGRLAELSIDNRQREK